MFQEGQALQRYDDESTTDSTPLLGLGDDDQPPPDRFWASYWILYLFGIVSLLPWYTFPNVEQYFRLQLRDEHPHLASHIVNYIAIASQVPAAVILFTNIYIIERISERTRILTSLAIITLMFALNAVLAWLDVESWQLAFFIVTISSVVIINTASCVFQGGVFALAGRFPMAYRQAVVSGQGFGGLLAASSNIVSMLAAGGPDHLTKTELAEGAIGYFSTSVVITSVTAIGFIALGKLPFARYFPTRVMLRRLRRQSWKMFFADIRRILRDIGPMALSTFLVFVVSLSVYPALTAKIHSVQERPGSCNASDTNSTSAVYQSSLLDGVDANTTASGLMDKAWVCSYFQPVTCFLLFQVMNFLGRTLPGKVRFPSHRHLLVPVVCRFALLALYVFCKYSVHHRPYFNSDAAPIVLMIVLGFTNGYFNSLAFMYAPTLVKEDDAETAGAIMAASEGLSSLFGVLFCLLLTNIYTGTVQERLPLVLS